MSRTSQILTSSHSKENKNPLADGKHCTLAPTISTSGPSVSTSFILRANTLSASAGPSSTGNGKSAGAMELFEFLRNAELEHYFTSFHEQLRVRTVAQLKYVLDSDLQQMGLTAPEQRRLWKFFERRYPQTTAGKLRKRLSRSTSGRASGGHGHNSDDVCNSGVSSNLLNGHGMKESLHQSGDLLLDDEDLATSPFIQRHHHLILPEHLELGTQLGEGEFGKVHQGVWHSESGPIQVAIKVLGTTLLDTGQMTDFLKEVAVMHSISHANIVRLYGVVMEPVSVQMVTELAPLRSLLECLREETLRSSLTILQLHTFSLQIAQGMAYLERKRLIHRDLAARNILVFSKDKVKISDFGMSKALQLGAEYYQTNINVNMKLPMAWCAPESINYLRFTSSSDVWAYGVVLWELFSYGFQPWAGLTGDQILDQIDEPVCARLSKPELCPSQHYELMLNCWEHEARKRCSFQQIVGQLPRMAPERYRLIQDVTDSSSNSNRFSENGPRNSHLENTGAPLFSKGDGVIVLDKGELWKTYHLGSNRVALFPASYLAPVLGVGTSDTLSTAAASEMGNSSGSGVGGAAGIYQYITGRLKRSKRSSEPPSHSVTINARAITRDMISLPQNDFRHIMHVGSDGNTFGDVGFLKNVGQEHVAKSGASPAITVRSECDRESIFGDGSSLNSTVSGLPTNATGGGSGTSSIAIKTSANRPQDGVSSPSDTLTSVSDLDPSGQASILSSTFNSSGSTNHKMTASQQHHFQFDESRKSFKDKFVPLLPSNGSSNSTRPSSTCTSQGRIPSHLTSAVNGEPSDTDSDGSEAYECIEVNANPAGGNESAWQSPSHPAKFTKSLDVSHVSSPPTLPPARPQSSAVTHTSFTLQQNTWEEKKYVDEKPETSTMSSLGGSLFDDILKCLDSIGTLSSDDAITPQANEQRSSNLPIKSDNNIHSNTEVTASREVPSSTFVKEDFSRVKSSFEAPSTVDSHPKQQISKKRTDKKVVSEVNSLSSNIQAPLSGKLERKTLFSSFRPNNQESNSSSNTNSSTAVYSKPFKNGLALPFTGKKNKSHSVQYDSGPAAAPTTLNVISGPVLISTTNTHFNANRCTSDADSVVSSNISSSHITGSLSRNSSASNTLSIQTTSSGSTSVTNGITPVNNGFNTGGGAMRALQRNKDGVFLASTSNSGAIGSGTLQRRRVSQTTNASGPGATSIADNSIPAGNTLNRTRQPSLPLTTQVARSITEVVASGHSASGATLSRRLSLAPTEEQDNESTISSQQISPSRINSYQHPISYSPQRDSQTTLSSTTSALSSSSVAAAAAAPVSHINSSQNKQQKKEDDMKVTSVLADDFWGDEFSKWMCTSVTTKQSDIMNTQDNRKDGISLIETCETRLPAFSLGDLDDDEEVLAL